MTTDDEKLAHLHELMDERDRRYEQRYEASQKALEAALLAADRAVQAALLAAKEAVQKAELSADKRFELLNELRSGVATMAQFEALEKIVIDLSKRMNVNSGRSSGYDASWKLFTALAGLAGLVLGLAFKFFG
jgi:chromosome condensin MukBEF ATPase and DNA-binding subunit MukB